MANSRHLLASGREIVLTDFRQEAVYRGLLEGLPTRERNQATIERLRDDARERSGGHLPFVIEPVQTPIEYVGRYPFGTPASLPDIACVGTFVSEGRDVLTFTQLTVIWFQDDFAFPMSDDARAAIAALDWDALAEEQKR